MSCGQTSPVFNLKVIKDFADVRKVHQQNQNQGNYYACTYMSLFIIIAEQNTLVKFMSGQASLVMEKQIL